MLRGWLCYTMNLKKQRKLSTILGFRIKKTCRRTFHSATRPFLSFLLLRENLSWLYLAALMVMLGGTALVVVDTLKRKHTHLHAHTFTHTHDGSTHTHTIIHAHDHGHYLTEDKHGHRHSIAELESAAKHDVGA